MLFCRSKTLVLLMTALLLTTLGPNAQGDDSTNPAVMLINGQPVFAGEFTVVIDNLIEQARQQGSELTAEQAFPAAVKRVIEQKLLSQEARRIGIQADEQRVQETLQSLIEDTGGRSQLEQRLQRAGQSIERLTDSIRETDLVRQLVSDHLKPLISVSDEEVHAYWRQHPERFQHPEQLHLRQILCSGADDDTARREAARRCARSAINRLAAGESFLSVARELSDGPAADRGGDLGYVDPGLLPAPVAAAAWKLDRGTLSAPIESDLGVHVIVVEGHRPAGISALEEIRSQVVSMIRIERSSEALEKLVAQLRKDAVIEAVEGAPTLPELIDRDDAS